MNRFNLPDINLLEKSPDTILAEMLQHVYEKTGLELQRSDPRRKMLESLAAFVSFERNRHEYAIKQNMLAYAEDNALDLKGDELGTPRLPANAAKTFIEYDLEPERTVPFIIPKGTQVRIADLLFAATANNIIPVGQHKPLVEFEALQAGSVGNGYVENEPTTLIEPQPYVIKVRNTMTTAGGNDVEENDPYAERIRLAPEAFTTAGSSLAYKYYALSASQDIADVYVDSPFDGVTRIVTLLKNGELPSPIHLDAVLEKCSAEDVRPLTDHVIAEAPTVFEYDMTVEYWLSSNKMTVANELINRIEQAFADYLVWQKSKLGRAINPTEVINRLKNLDTETKGAERVEVSTPYTEIKKDEIAVANVTSITFKGFIDE